MATAEKFELILIPVLGASFLLIAPSLPDKVGVGRLLLIISALLLFQSLVRDLWLLAGKKPSIQAEPIKKTRCMCIESTVGASGVIIGIFLLGAGFDHFITISGWTWSLLVMVVLTTGFLIKDFVMGWNPLRIRRDKNHMNIIFT